MWVTVANHLWQSTLFVALVALLTLGFRNDGAHVRYWLWWAASVKFLVPFSMLTALGRWAAPIGPARILPEAWSSAAERVASPVTGTGSPSLLVLTLIGLWACGVLAVAAQGLARARRVRCMSRRSEPAEMPLSAVASRIEVRFSSELVEPAVVGIFSPALLLPRGIAERLTPAQLQAVLAHELCHARRRDNLTAAVHMLVEALCWFHPLVWWIGARLLEERERACDEAVVRSGHDRAAYAEGILDVCALYARSPLACAAGVSGADLKRRITQIMRGDVMSELGFRKKVLLGAIASGIVGAPMLAGFVSQSTALAQEDGVWLPIVKIAPRYPERALERGLEGYVVLEYTVNERGGVEDVTVLESSSTLFDEAAIESVSKYKYAPREENGQHVAVPGVRSIVRFELVQDI